MTALKGIDIKMVLDSNALILKAIVVTLIAFIFDCLYDSLDYAGTGG